MELLKSHRSIRKYKPESISKEVLDELIECGIRASNTGNMQLYSIIVTSNTERKAMLAPYHFNQPMVLEAPVLLTICIDLNRFEKWCKLNNTISDFTNLLWLLNGAIDTSILAQNICIAAENLGLGICYLGTTLYNAPEISEILLLPKGVIPITALTIGYPEVIPDWNDRLPLEAVVHYESYVDYSDEKIAELYLEKESLESSRLFVYENGKENLAQVYTEVRYRSGDNQFFSTKLLKMLTEQGFSFK